MLQVIKNKIILLIILLCLMLTIFSSVAFASSEKTVYVKYNTKTTKYITSEETFGDFLTEANIPVESNSVINVDLTTELSSEEDNYIHIVTPVTVYFSIDGVDTSTTVNGTMTTDEFISKLEQQNNQVYSVVYEYPEYIADVTSLELYTNSTQQFVSTKIIPFETKYVDNPDLPLGTENIVEAGTYGEEQIVIEVTFENGVETSRNIISDTVISEPTTQVVERGTLNENNNSTTGNTIDGYTYSSKMTMNASAYTIENNSGVTAIGMPVKHGVVAVDPNVIPLGTHLYIPGYGEAIAADTGGSIKGNTIDLYFETLSEALAFGTKNIDVYILE